MVGGLISSTILILIILPAVYLLYKKGDEPTLFQSNEKRKQQAFKKAFENE